MKRKRRKKIIRRMLLCLILLIIAAIAIFIMDYKKVTDNPEPTDTTEKITEQTLSIENSEESEDNTPVEEDIRKIKNTATEESHKTNGLAICMYHYVYEKDNPPANLNNNYIELSALEEELKYLVENDYFFPTWEEVRQYVDGELLLPEKSVVLTFDDGDQSFLELGLPLFNKYEIPVTSFLITSWGGANIVAQYDSAYVSFESHSDNMHRGGGNIGHGGIFPALSHDEAVADLQRSIDACQSGDAFAYPFGDYTEGCVEALKDAGFLCAVTTEYGRVHPGDNPLLLSRIRMLEGQSLESFIKLVE